MVLHICKRLHFFPPHSSGALAAPPLDLTPFKLLWRSSLTWKWIKVDVFLRPVSILPQNAVTIWRFAVR